MSTLYRKAEFEISAAELKQLPYDKGIEVAFIGRSNAGKSSAINTITDHKSLARISKTPGRTQLINVFNLDGTRRIIDLPGYGFAKVSGNTKAHWAELINNYLHQRECLKGLILVMDCRHPLKPLDIKLIEWTADNNIPVHILLTKSDKLRYGARVKVLDEVRKELKELENEVTVQLFSSFDKVGLEEAKNQLDKWYELA